MGLILDIDDYRLWTISAMKREFGSEIPDWHRVIPRVPEEPLEVPERESEPDYIREIHEFVSSDAILGDIYMEQQQHYLNRNRQRFVKVRGVAVYFTDLNAAMAFKMRYG